MSETRRRVFVYAKNTVTRFLLLLPFISLPYADARDIPTASASIARPFVVEKSLAREQAIQVAVSPGTYERLSSGSDYITIEFPLPDRENAFLELERFDIIAPDARFVTGGGTGGTPCDKPQVLLYRGMVASDPLSHAYLAFTSSEAANGYVTFASGERYFISQGRSGSEEKRRGLLTIHRESPLSKLPEFPLFCGVEPLGMGLMNLEGFDKEITGTIGGLRVANVAMDGDQAYVQLFESTSEAFDYTVQLIGVRLALALPMCLGCCCCLSIMELPGRFREVFANGSGGPRL